MSGAELLDDDNSYKYDCRLHELNLGQKRRDNSLKAHDPIARALEELNAARLERDEANAACKAALEERDAAVEERDAMAASLQFAVDARKILEAMRKTANVEKNAAIEDRDAARRACKATVARLEAVIFALKATY